LSRIGIYGNAPICPSGYGTQAAQLGRTLGRHGHEVGYLAFHGVMGAPLLWENSTVYPGSGEDPWAQDLMGAHYRHFRGDLLITLMDAWVLDPAKLTQAGMNFAHWMPVDCEPLGQLDRRVLDAGGGRPIAISRFGQKQLQAAGYDAAYAPHALDMSLWKPQADRDARRRALGFGDRFVVAINAANQDPFRKGFGEQLEAFASFSKHHDDALMLIHARGETRQGLNLHRLIADLGLEKKAILGDQYLISSGLVPEDQMAAWHGLPDVLMNCAYGEGFGLAVLQSQATGTPVIVTDCSAMTELCGAGWLVQGQRFRNRGHDSWWRVPFVSEIERALDEAYEKAGSLREQAREFALAYDAEKVYEDHWEAILGELIPGA
jgi:glycosyltransferase involved in cell wall biosynthesis